MLYKTTCDYPEYIKRNLAHIEQLMAVGASLSWLSKRQYKMLLVVTEVYRQQLWMWSNRKQSIENRIVSLTQPHVRPIVRGKAGKPGSSLPFMLNQQTRCQDNILLTQKFRKFLKP